MTRIFRLLQILHTVGRMRLDRLFDRNRIALRYRVILAIFSLYPKPKNNRAECLRMAFEQLGPIFIKFGQLLSTRPDLLPPDLVVELNKLQDQVPPFDNADFKAIVESALNDKVENLFESFDEHPLASASIAQVHAATLKDGSQVVVKALRPNLERTINKDISLLKLLARCIEKFHRDGKRLRPLEIVDNYEDTINDELDLMQEAANASQLRRNFENSDKLYVPQVYWDFTRRNVMVMERIYGIPVSDTQSLKAQSTDLKKLAERGVEIFFTQVFDHNFFHADMHPGNVFVSRDNPSSPSYIAVDMAIVGSLNKEDQYYLARNLLAMFRRDYRQVAELHVLSGWVPKGTSIGGFESAIRAVCEPIFQKPLKDISFGEALITLFRTAQRFDMPVQPQLVLLQKTLVNIEGLGRQLYPELDLWETAHPFLERWLRERFHPKNLWKEFKYNAPEWMEKLPELPHLVYNTLEEVKTLAAIAPQLQKASEAIEKRRSSPLRYLLPIGIVAASLVAYFYLPDNLNLPREVLPLLGVCVASLSLR